MAMMEKMKKLMAEPIDDDDWEDDYDYDQEWEEDYDEEGDEKQEVQVVQQELPPGAIMRPLRVMSNAANRQCNVGIHTVEIYYPQFYLKQIEMEEYDARPDRYGPSVIGKYTKGIGQIEARFPSDDEDVVSYALTVTHKMIERMDRVGFNQTANYSFDGKQINHWNAFGRIDIGSESLIDRSKSMKTYVMDLFERYGNGEADIEGVDMYNACYGGQAAGLCVLNWVESDRWDGRYGMAIATDVSDAFNTHLFCVGAATTGTLFFPDAPLCHYSLRASCILHRFDFFKPVGWHMMGPLTDGKYSVNAYMDCVDMCHLTLKKKMNNMSVVKNAGFNVFHTGGGFHIVKKAYQRMMRSDDNKMPNAEKDKFLLEKLVPSTHILKIVGPCHTVSSFLNISSVSMTQWDKAIGKSLVVFTYGSGSAASMYQTLYNDVLWMVPFNQWLTQFYDDNSMLLYPDISGRLHDKYIATWMKFGYIPNGRQENGIDPWKYQSDVYYLMEIDVYGRRFYHRGGIIAEPMDKKWDLEADRAEGRKMRPDWGPLPPKPVKTEGGSKKDKTLDDVWKDIEVDMLNAFEPPKKEVIQEAYSKTNPQHRICSESITDTANLEMIKFDGERHTYQIVGTWTGLKEAEEMQSSSDELFLFDITVGENGWEEFYLLQDGDWERKIFPAVASSWKAMPCVGPYNMPEPKHWLVDSRFGAPLEDTGSPGDKYRVSFSWSNKSVKRLEWSKLEGQSGPFKQGTYSICGVSATPLEMKSDGEGKFTKEFTMSSRAAEFYLVRNEDEAQRIYPDVDLDKDGNATSKGTSGDRVLGVAPWPSKKAAPVWEVSGSLGSKVMVTFTRNPDLPDEMDLEFTVS